MNASVKIIVHMANDWGASLRILLQRRHTTNWKNVPLFASENVLLTSACIRSWGVGGSTLDKPRVWLHVHYPIFLKNWLDVTPPTLKTTDGSKAWDVLRSA